MPGWNKLSAQLPMYNVTSVREKVAFRDDTFPKSVAGYNMLSLGILLIMVPNNSCYLAGLCHHKTKSIILQWSGWNKKLLVTLVEDEPKALFQIATILRCRGGYYSILWMAPLYPWSWPYNAEC